MARLTIEPPLSARTSGALRVLSIDRISTLNQDPQSNADQRALNKRWVEERYDGPIDWTYITGQGSGELTDRQQVRDAEDHVTSGTFDLVIMEDLGRHLRRARAIDFCESCEDAGTRLIAINDSIDTAQDWRLHAFFAAIKHEQSNKDTSGRIKRSLRNRFVSGGVIQTFVYGYLKPPGAKSDIDCAKDPAAGPIYEEWFQRLEDGATYAEIADWLNKKKIPVGPGSRLKHWTPQAVGNVTRNSILKGVRVRNKKVSKRINKTGRYRSVNAPVDERLERHCPHLAFIEPDRYDRVIAMLDERNKRFSARFGGSQDSRRGRPKKLTIWPGQHARCGICGRYFRYGGHGQAQHLECRGATEYSCWNGITIDGPLARQKVGDAILSLLESLPDFDSTFISLLREEAVRLDSARVEQLAALKHQEVRIQSEIVNILTFIRNGHAGPSVQAELTKLEHQQEDVLRQRKQLECAPAGIPELPPIAAVRQLAREEFGAQDNDPYKFARLMRSLIPDFTVFPYRRFDGGKIVLRAHFEVTPVPLLPVECRRSAEHLMRHSLVVDLFDDPQPVVHRERVAQLRHAGQKFLDIGIALGITDTAAQRAFALHQAMVAAGRDDPYERLLEPPMDDGRMRRHLHSRYHFQPLSTHDA